MRGAVAPTPSTNKAWPWLPLIKKSGYMVIAQPPDILGQGLFYGHPAIHKAAEEPLASILSLTPPRKKERFSPLRPMARVP
jgi:hypothetical protein